MNTLNYHRPLLSAAAALLLAISAACTTAPSVRSGDPATLEQRARQEQESGNLRVAAELYRELADTVGGAARVDYLLEASRLALARGDTAAATAWLRDAQSAANTEQQQAIVVLMADVDLQSDRAANALARLDRLQQPLPLRVRTDRDSVRGRALFVLGRYREAVETLVERETWLDNARDILDNQRMIWDGLTTAQAGAGQPDATGDAVIDGWLALGPIAAADIDSAELRRALLDWRRSYMTHPAAGGLLAELLGDVRPVDEFPRQVALLLPISSQQRAAAVAIRDGFLAAHFAARTRDPQRADATTIRVYDTGILGGQEAYVTAQLEGADFIVGPLLRPEVEQVVAQGNFVPTLALNFAESDTSLLRGFYQFALWPEDEAQAVARRAIAAGARTAVALVPSNELGYRLLNSFRAEFESLGGTFLGFNGYEPSAQDFSGPIESLLNIDRSQQRRTRLAANLNTGVIFEPRRRQDVDMIFLGADRAAGRLLAPALRFHFAGDIPTYATSDIYEPGATARDTDLNDIFFPDAPWLLSPDQGAAEIRRALESFWPQRAPSNIRLYGMGVDAYQLVGSLFSGFGDWPLDGVSGQLELDAAGRVHRVLPFAQFRNGRPVALEPQRPEIERLGSSQPGELAGFR
jgi:uncharacterized protein